MKTAAQFVHDVYYGEGEEGAEQQWLNAVVARDREIRAAALREGYNDGRAVALWDAVEIAQEHEERGSKGCVISENIRAEALHADKVKDADAARAERGE